MIAALANLEPVVTDLRATATILSFMITANGENHQTSEKEDDAWRKVENDLRDLTQRVVDLWNLDFDQHREEIGQLKEEHKAAIAALRAEKAAPGSEADAGKVDTCWRMLAAAAYVAVQYCAESGYKLEPFGPKAGTPEPAPQTERMKW
jgi:hypothetical protein